MKLILAVAVWLIVGALVGAGMLIYAHKGLLWPLLLISGLLVVWIGAVGYRTH